MPLSDQTTLAERLTRLETLAEQAHADREKMQMNIERIASQIGELNAMLNQVRGARFTIAIIISIASMAGGVLAYFGIKTGVTLR